MNSDVIALNHLLEPITALLEDDINEVMINSPTEVFVEKRGDIISIELGMTFEDLKALADLIASFNAQEINERAPLLSGNLPGGERVQVAIPPVVSKNTVAMAVRKPSTIRFTLDDYENQGAFADIEVSEHKDESETLLQDHLAAGRIKEFLALAVKSKKNILISGGTGTGKTTFANAMTMQIPDTDRVITIEDAREIQLSQPNKLHLLASKGDQGTANIGIIDLLESCLRLRPYIIFLAELRGKEAFSYLRAVNTGHPGSISTLHADTPEGAMSQLVLMVMQAGVPLQKHEIIDYIESVIDLIIQIKRDPGGRRYISDIRYLKQEQ